MSNIHVIDGDVFRRNRVANNVVALHHHAEIYESFSEFELHNPSGGLLLVAQEESEKVVEALGDGRCRMPVALYASSPTAKDVKRAFRAGVVDVLAWPSQDDDLATSLNALILDCEQRSAVIGEIAAAKRSVADLSRREAEVLAALVSGASNKEIGADLGISPRTVEIHRSNVLRKVGARSTAEAVRIGIYAGLVPEIAVSAV